MDSLQRQPPPGLRIVSQSAEVVVIEHTRQNNGCLVAFHGGFFVMFTGAAIWLSIVAIHHLNRGIRPPQAIFSWFPILFWGVSLFTAGEFLYFKSCRQRYVLRRDHFTVESRLWVFHWTAKHSTGEIHSFKQIQDGGDGGTGDSSFPTWGLILIGPQAWLGRRREVVIYCEQRSQSDWLGPVLADWYGVPFEPAVDETNESR